MMILQIVQVWTSTLARTIQTAGKLSYHKLTWKSLDELDAGVCDGMTYEEIAVRFIDLYLLAKLDLLTDRSISTGTIPGRLRRERRRQVQLSLSRRRVVSRYRRSSRARYYGIRKTREYPNHWTSGIVGLRMLCVT
jgi:Histidine phosphatase superfamily (branch 1)